MFFVPAVYAAECKDVFPQLSELRAKMLEAYNAKKLDKALEPAVEMQKVGDTHCVDRPDIRLMLAMNVAQILINQKKTEDAQKIYDANLILAEEIYGQSSPDFERFTEDLLKLSVRNTSVEQYEPYAIKALAARESRFGAESPEYLKELVRIARFYAAWKKPDKAEEYFTRGLDVAEKLTEKDAEIIERAVNSYRFFLIKTFGEVVGLSKGNDLMVKRFPNFPLRPNLVQGLAYSLPKPKPVVKNIAFFGESITVEIKIDAAGNVLSASAKGGSSSILRQATEQAAMEAKFLPTYLKGSPVSVTGSIVYRFQ